MFITIIYLYAMYKCVQAFMMVGALTRSGVVGVGEGVLTFIFCAGLAVIGTIAHMSYLVSKAREAKENKNV